MATILLQKSGSDLNKKPKASRPQNSRIEAALVSVIQDWFVWNKIRCERLNSGATKLENRFIRFGFHGCPDLMIFDQTIQVGFMEVKTPTGQLSKEQREFQRFCQKHRIPHLVARSLDEAIAWWRRYVS